MPQMAGDHGCGVKSRVKVVEPSQQQQQQPEQVKTGLCTQSLGARCALPGAAATARQLCSGRSEREPKESDALLVSTPLLWQSAAHISPHSSSSAALPRRLNLRLLHTFTTPQQHPHLLLPPLYACLCSAGWCSLHAQSLIIYMIPSMESNSSSDELASVWNPFFKVNSSKFYVLVLHVSWKRHVLVERSTSAENRSFTSFQN